MASSLEIVSFKCLSDNVGVLLHDPKTGATAAIDAPEEGPIRAVLEERGWRLTDLLITHHHHDHVGALAALKARYGCRVVGPRAEADRIDGLDLTVVEGDRIKVGTLEADILDLKGHTAGQIGYFFADMGMVFVGDTLFEYGCGRLFEGTPADMWASLSRLARLPSETVVYFGHDYGLSNGRFARALDPDNTDLAAAFAETEARAAAGTFRTSTTIGLERLTNPFMRSDTPAIQAAVGMVGASPEDVLGEVRARKNRA